MKSNIKKKIKKDQILLSAISVVNSNGYENTTMEDISKKLQMTKGSLYYYFKNKNDLMYQCHVLLLSLAIKDLTEIIKAELPAEITMRKMVATHIEYAIEEKQFFNVIFDPISTFDKKQLAPILSARKEYSRLFDEVIQKGVEERAFHVADPTFVRQIMLGAMNWVQQWYQPNGRLTKLEVIEKYGDYIIKLLK